MTHYLYILFIALVSIAAYERSHPRLNGPELIAEQVRLDGDMHQLLKEMILTIKEIEK